MTSFDISVSGCVARGFRKASGVVPYLEPGGTIAAQVPRFLERGLDITDFYRGTINLCIKPHLFEVKQPKITLRDVAWSERHIPEHFSFLDCLIEWPGGPVDALVYLPHPETKASHFHDSSTLELLSSHLEGLRYGTKLTVRLSDSQVSVRHAGKRIFHLLPAAAWKALAAGDDYAAPSLASEGFVHCSELEALLEVADRIFFDCADLVALEIDPLLLEAPLIYELAENFRVYPHVYGPLSRAAIVAVHELTAGHGGFALPGTLA